jgi:hypothetical protein
VIEASQAQHVVPVALSHAGWVAIELRRRLGALIPKLVLLDWSSSKLRHPSLAPCTRSKPLHCGSRHANNYSQCGYMDWTFQS